MHCGKRENAIWRKQCLLGAVKFRGSLKIAQCLWGVRNKISQTEKTPLPTCDFINEKSLKLTKIFN